MAEQPTPKKPASPPDFVRREINAVTRILGALRTLSPQRSRAVMDYINGLYTAATLERAENAPERPGQDQK